MEVLKQLHISVAQEFEKLFDDAYSTLHTDLVRHDARFREVEERATLADQKRNNIAIENQKLRRENSLLREEIRRNDIGQEDTDDLENLAQLKDRYSPEHLVSVFQTGEQEDGYTAEDRTKFILDKYASLFKDFQTLLNASKDLKNKIKRDKKKLHYWRTLLTKKEFSLMLDKGEVRFKQIEDTDTSVHPSARESTMSSIHPPLGVDNGAPAEPSLSTSDLTPNKVNDHHSVSPTPIGVDFKQNTDPVPQVIPLAPASTQSDPYLDNDEMTPISQSPRDPEALGNQILKRKRELIPDLPSAYSQKRTLPADGQLEQPILVKSESLSSSPLRNLIRNQGPFETQDLDDIGDTVETPTKRKSSRLNLNPLNSVSNALKSPLRQYRHRTEPIRRYPKQRTVLQLVDSNLRVNNGSINIRPEQKSTKKPMRSSGIAISSLAEDGDENLYPTPRKDSKKQAVRVQSKHSKLNLNGPLTHKRLDDLLKQPLPSRRPLDMPRKQGNVSDKETTSGTATCPFDPHTEKRQKKISDGGERNEPYVNWSTAPATEQDEPQVAEQETLQLELKTAPNAIDLYPQEGPYRARPLHRLDLRHFKINPENNQGLNFAYDTVVRGKDDRKCMTGCTRPGCCGDKFLAMARLGGTVVNPETSCQKEDEQRILQEYLGEEQHLLDHLSAEDRQQLLHEAIARRIANTYGKHRHDHHRSSTPPGFWRADMPDTQELEDDHTRAQQLEREKVKERYMEAMRGGLWKFADE